MLRIAVGAGQCGFAVLDALVSAQPGWTSHMYRCSPVPWYGNGLFWKNQLRQSGLDSHKRKRVEIAHYWLPYAEKAILKSFAKVLYIRRDQDDQLESLLRTYSQTNPWSLNPGEDAPGEMACTFPKYHGDKRQACLAYLANYERIAFGIAQRHPESVMMVNYEDLRSPDGQRAVLHWLGVDRPFIPNLVA